ncbi:MAG: 50S ribosomal protein L18 [Thermoplasmata archaeon]|mgnify:CR=1 FL=1|nr:MAG: 50S ribosomal protein L18 [Thermoplasmata archaeon]RLF52730.1 MAG: 50S ribosomal protein L18 [Thermoplasmata archaeon]
MKQGPRYRIKPRRRREGRTDYRKRLKLLKSRKTRLVVRKSLKNTLVQFIEYKEEGDNVIATATSKELTSKYNWKFSTSTTPAAYLTGLLAGKRAKEKGIKECILDTGRHVPVAGSKIFASLKGVIDAGVECPCSEEKIPSEERIMGKHLNENIMSAVNDIKSKIIGGK